MRILLTGASGLVGQGVLREALADPGVTHVSALVRQPLPVADARLSLLQVAAFDALEPVADALAPFDACLYCAGAPPLGTPEADYRRVTLDLTLHVAEAFARRNPSARFLYVSGAHADPDSRLMPLRVKGETERALQALPIVTVMLRPGGVQPVGGERSPHAWMRPMYRVAGPLLGLARQLVPGVVTSTSALGRAMLVLARMPAPPAVVENAQINRLGAPP